MKLLRVEEIARSTVACHFERPEAFTFTPGQFVEIALKQESPEDPYRSFSIASCPAEPTLMIATRARSSSFKHALLALPAGTDVQVDGPYGKLNLVKGQGDHHVFIAGGIGITPFRSILLDCASTEAPEPISLFYSNRDVESAPFMTELQELCGRVPSIHLIPTLTAMSDGWQGESGHIDATMLGRHVSPLTSRYYVSGPPAMVTAMKQMLAGMGVPANRIQSESFSGY